MSQVTTGVRSVLSNPRVYEAFQLGVGAGRVRKELLGVLDVRAGMRVLDIGCGPADILADLPDVEYVGVEPSVAYVRSAAERFGDRGRFVAGGIDVIAERDLGMFDRIFAKGVLHHVADDLAAQLFTVAARQLVPDGLVVTLDPTRTDDQSRAARFMVGRDRGQAVRTPSAYAAFAHPHFSDVDVSVHHDLLRIPYSHAIVTCRDPRA